MSGELCDEAVYYLSPARFHFIALGHDFGIFLSGILIKGFMLIVSQNDTLKKRSNFVSRKII